MELVYIEWLDSCGPDGWHDPEKAKKIIKSMRIKSVGWVTDETEEVLILTGHIHIKHKHHHAAIAIPKCAITKREVIILSSQSRS